MTETAKWYEKAGNCGDVVISTRIRLARNLRGYPFPASMDDEQKARLVDTITAAAKTAAGTVDGIGTLTAMPMENLPPLRAMSLVERHLISPEFARSGKGSALLLSEESAAALNGQYSMAMDMPNMVASFVYPVTMSLIPFAAAALARQDHAGADRIISSAFRIIAILALPAGIGLSVLSTPIMVLVLPAQREDALAAGPHLQVLGIALIFICLMILTNAILQTYGKEKLPIFTVIVGGIVKIIMNYFLVGNPDINIHGAPISTLCCYLVIVVLNLFFVWKYSPQKPRYLEVFAKPVAASLLMGGAAWAIYGLASRVLDGAFLALAQQMFADPDKIQLWSVYLANAACVLLGILAGVIVYGVLVIALRILRAEDVRSIPRGEKLIKLLHLK